MRIIEQFTVGSKVLALFQFATDEAKNSYGAWFLTDQDAHREVDETTRINEAAETFLRQRLNAQQPEITYVVDTENQQLILWMQHKAPWKWDKLEESGLGLRGEVTFRLNQ